MCLLHTGIYNLTRTRAHRASADGRGDLERRATGKEPRDLKWGGPIRGGEQAREMEEERQRECSDARAHAWRRGDDRPNGAQLGQTRAGSEAEKQQKKTGCANLQVR